MRSQLEDFLCCVKNFKNAQWFCLAKNEVIKWIENEYALLGIWFVIGLVWSCRIAPIHVDIVGIMKLLSNIDGKSKLSKEQAHIQ
jgi:hypothetical protein